ncbi:hypothetical protein ACEQPO_13545 [Bacillus sp. SL00103]
MVKGGTTIEKNVTIHCVCIFTARFISNDEAAMAAVTYIESMKEHAEVASVSKDILYQEIESKSSDYEVKAAKMLRLIKCGKRCLNQMDRRLISMPLMKNEKHGSFDEKPLVFNETKPSIHLHELGAEPIYKGHPDKKMNAFLINVAWGDEHLIKMLKTLEKHQVKATFFLEGKWRKKHGSC